MQVHSALFALAQILTGLSLFLARVILQSSSHFCITFGALITSSHLPHGQRWKFFISETQ